MMVSPPKIPYMPWQSMEETLAALDPGESQPSREELFWGSPTTLGALEISAGLLYVSCWSILATAPNFVVSHHLLVTTGQKCAFLHCRSSYPDQCGKLHNSQDEGHHRAEPDQIQPCVTFVDLRVFAFAVELAASRRHAQGP